MEFEEGIYRKSAAANMSAIASSPAQVVLMPPIFASMCKFVFRSERTLTGVHQHVFQRYFLLLYYNVLIVLVLSGTFSESLMDLTSKTPSDAVGSLGISFARISCFYIDYVTIKIGCGLSLEITRFSCFFQAGIKAIFSNDLTAQQRENMVIGCRSLTRSGGFYYGRFLAEHCLSFVLIFTYSVIAPLILLFGSLFFCMATIVYKRQLLWCYEPEISARGEFWPQCFRRVVYGLVTSQVGLLCMTCFLESYDKVPFVLVLPPITLIYSKYVQRIYGRAAAAVPLNVALSVDRIANDECGGIASRAESMRDAYMQPSLVSEPEPIHRGDGGFDRSTKRFLGCCCALNMVPDSNPPVRESNSVRDPTTEPFVALPRRRTRGLSWGRKFSANV